VLRLLAHLLTRRLWEAGRHPLLVTMDMPTVARPVAGTDELLVVWVSRTLHPPDIPTALHAATTYSRHPTLTLTTHYGASAHPAASARHQLVTTHQPGHPPRCAPSSPHHRHVAPDVDGAHLAELVAEVLTTAARQP